MTKTYTYDELAHEAHNACVAISLRMGKRSFNQQKRAYEAWLAKYIPLAEALGLPDEVLGMRRSAALWLLAEAAEAQRPACAFEPLLCHLEALGWQSLERKALSIGAMCAYFADRMWRREGLRHLLPLKRELEQEYARTGDQTWFNYQQHLARIERRLRARGRPF